MEEEDEEVGLLSDAPFSFIFSANLISSSSCAMLRSWSSASRVLLFKRDTTKVRRSSSSRLSPFCSDK